MSAARKGPSTAARENLGALFDVLEILPAGARQILVLACPGSHRINVAIDRAAKPPKKGRCKVCPRPTCGATNRDGDACTLAPKHARITGPRHENGAKSWSYDARIPAAPAKAS